MDDEFNRTALEDKIRIILEENARIWDTPPPYNMRYILDQILQLLSAEVERKVREARIDELVQFQKEVRNHSDNVGLYGLDALVLFELIKKGDATTERRHKYDHIVTERRAEAIVTGIVKQHLAALLKFSPQ